MVNVSPFYSLRARSYCAGFTLLEVMIAIGVTALTAALAYQGLRVTITAAEQQSQQARQLSAMQTTFRFLEHDIQHSVNRPIVDGDGHQQAALVGGAAQDTVLQLSRRGWTNPQGLRRSELQRVRYVLTDNALWRENWLVMDRLNEEDGLQRALLMEGVLSWSITFLYPTEDSANPSPQGGQWVDHWGDDAATVNLLPMAIRIQLLVDTIGEIYRVFDVW